MRSRLKAFALATGERAVKTFAQTTAATLVADKVSTVVALDWEHYLGIGAFAALLSVLFSVGSGTVGSSGPSLVGEKLDTTVQRAPETDRGDYDHAHRDWPQPDPDLEDPGMPENGRP